MKKTFRLIVPCCFEKTSTTDGNMCGSYIPESLRLLKVYVWNSSTMRKSDAEDFAYKKLKRLSLPRAYFSRRQTLTSCHSREQIIDLGLWKNITCGKITKVFQSRNINSNYWGFKLVSSPSTMLVDSSQLLSSQNCVIAVDNDINSKS